VPCASAEAPPTTQRRPARGVPAVPDQNIFMALSRYSGSAQENYLTECLVFVVRLLLQQEEEPAVNLLNRICGLKGSDAILSSEHPVLQTQVKAGEGRPDIEIQVGSRLLVYIEVKHDAPVSQQQLKDYRDELDRYERRTGRSGRLVLLSRTRCAPSQSTAALHHDHHVCWYEIHRWLDAGFSDPIAMHYIRALQTFLEEKKMSLNQVTWEYIRGMEALLNLTTMLEAAIREAMPGSELRLSFGWNWRGFFAGDVWCGVRHDRPLVVAFENKGGTNPTYKRDLDLDKAHFFCLSKDEQFETLVDFVRQAGADLP